MTGAFLYLTFCSLRNRARVRFRRLKEPRYLIGLVAGLLYLYSFAFRNAFRAWQPGKPNGSVIAILGMYAGPAVAIGSMVFFVLAALAWLWPGGRPALLFSRAEVQFLFQAPLSRRQLVHYKLIRTQIGTVFGSAVATLFLRPGSLMMAWTFSAGLWMIFSIISLHMTGISLSRQSVSKLGVIGLARQWLPFAVVLGAIGILVATAFMDWQHLAAIADPRDVMRELERIATTGPAAIVLWPFRAMLRVPLAPSRAAFWAALPWGLLILVVNYLWVLQADAAFEEASAVRAEKVATRVAAIRSGKITTPTLKGKPSGTATPFTLSLTGRPETAILWKNLIMVGRYLSLKTLFRILPLFIVLAVFSTNSGHRGGMLPVIAGGCFMFVFITLLLGPQMARNDLRQDLANLVVLKTWPVSGATLVRGELLAPMLVLTSIAWILIVAGAILSTSLQIDDPVGLSLALHTVAYAAVAVIVAPAIILAQLVVQNGLAITFPAWVTIGASRARGVEVTGQRMLMMAGNILALVLALLPGLIVGGGVAFAIYFTTGAIIVVLPAVLVSVVMFVECWLAIEILGKILDRTDVSALDVNE